jgi:hypothetical protein
MGNINTKAYWEGRFGSGDWQNRGGFNQTRAFTTSQMRHFEIPSDFSGSICDFGCGAGDAFPIYRENYPKSKLIGIDFSQAAIDICRNRFGHIAEFFCGDHNSVPEADVIIASNVFEHLENDKRIARVILEKCKKLYIIVPYNEKLLDGSEHVNTYKEDSFNEIGTVKSKTFYSLGWSYHGFDAVYQIRIKNVIRTIIGRPRIKREKQIMYIINGALNANA